MGGKGAEGTTVTTASTLIGRVKFVARWLAGWLLPPPLPQLLLLLLLLLLYTHVVSLSSPRAHHYPPLVSTLPLAHYGRSAVVPFYAVSKMLYLCAK